MTVQTPARGATARPSPKPYESPFGIEEIFFSTTDLKGIIRSGNRVFARVSKYARAELVGSPHNIIRHPDMPRVVFKLLWEEIEAGRPIAAYVKNMAKDGAYYWVLATVVPCAEGYLSVRIKPSTAYFEAVQPIYADLLAVEQAIEAAGPSQRPAAMEASRARLAELLAGAGFASYDAFMRTALLAEVAQRRAGTRVTPPGATGRPAPVGRPAPPAHPPGSVPSLAGVLGACEEISTFLSTLVARVDQYSALNDQLADKARFAVDLAEDVQLFSMNALLAATRLEAEGAALGAVSALIQARSDESAPVFQALADELCASSELLGTMLLPVAIASIQAEAVIAFVKELLEDRSDERATADDLGALAQCLATEVDALRSSLATLHRRLNAIVGHVDQLVGTLGVMRALELNGRIEAARVTGADGVVTLFRTIADKIVAARGEMVDLSRAGRFSFSHEVAAAQQSQHYLDTIRDVSALVAPAERADRSARADRPAGTVGHRRP